jgi:3-oxoadipate enol-lactonase
MDVRERRMETTRGEASWLEAGAGWPVVLLHAFPLNAEMWRPQLERVPQGWRFIAPDLRGCGRARATLPADADPLSMESYAADLWDLLDSLEIDEPIVAGLSMGGYVAFAMHRQSPARLTGLVLADTRSQADTPDQRALRTRLREVLAHGGTAALADQMLPNSLSSGADPAVVAEVRRLIEAGDSRGLDAALVAMMERPDSTPDLPRVSCATLIIAGELDKITPVADAEAMQRAIPRAVLTVIPAAGHLSSLEQPDQFSRVLADFLISRV